MASLFGALILLMAAGGLIAYLGDQLGYKMGKRRISLFGLRPRHAATASTIVGGVLIAGATFGVLLGINSSFRTALVQGAQLLQNNRRLWRDNTHLQVQARKAQATADSATQTAATAQGAALAARANTAVAVARLTTVQKSLAAANRQTKIAQLQVTQQKALLQVVSQKVTAEQSQVETEDKQISLARSQLIVLQARSRQAAQQLRLATQQLVNSVVVKDSAPVVYHAGDELGRTVIDAGQSEQSIHDDIVHFLTTLSEGALTLGAARGDNGRAVVVNTVEIEPSLQGDSHEVPTYIDEAGSINALASQIHDYGHGSVVIVASSLGNSFGGKTVIIGLHPYANKLVFHTGALLAATVINGKGSSFNEIVAQFQQFLVDKLRPAAMRSGVIPVRDPQEHRLELGDVPLDQLDGVVKQIQLVDGPCLIVASALHDTYAGDPLQLNFIIKSAGDTPDEHSNGQ